jgi:uncharacterized membrane protein YhaH (DUF805 family)
MIEFVKTYFWEVIRFHYVDFKERTSRKQYIYFFLFWLIISSLSIPAISIRRLHDANLRGWWYLGWFLLVEIVSYLFLKML